MRLSYVFQVTPFFGGNRHFSWVCVCLKVLLRGVTFGGFPSVTFRGSMEDNLGCPPSQDARVKMKVYRDSLVVTGILGRGTTQNHNFKMDSNTERNGCGGKVTVPFLHVVILGIYKLRECSTPQSFCDLNKAFLEHFLDRLIFRI